MLDQPCAAVAVAPHAQNGVDVRAGDSIREIGAGVLIARRGRGRMR